MKYHIFIALFLTGCMVASAAFDEKELKTLKKQTEISGVRVDTIKNDKREKIVTLEVCATRDEDHQTGFRMYIVAELTDKQKNTYIVEFAGNQREVDSDFLGEEYWELRMPEGELDHLKVTAYAIHYGIMEDDQFVLLAEEYDDVDSMEELKARTTTPFPGKCRLDFWYMYDDSSEGSSESIPMSVNKIKG